MKAKFIYTGIRVRDMDESIRFYTEVMGMKLKEERNQLEATGGEVAVVVSEDGGPEIELNYYKEGSKHYEPYSSGMELDHIAFHVDDVDNFLAEAKKLGYDMALEVKSKTGRWAFIRDPNGIFIEIS